MRKNSNVAQLYTPRVTAARARITSDADLATILHEDSKPEHVLGFLIQFSALGVFMTDKVESWIARAGRRCQALGHAELGRALVIHAKHEAGHDAMMVEDLHKLVPRWNSRYQPQLDARALLDQAPTEAMHRYVAIHEDTIASELPFSQIAIEYEIEMMSTVLGPALMRACDRALGPEIVKDMSFIAEHAAIDVGHTALNEVELDKFIANYPEQAEPLARTGADALGIYLDFLGDCARKGRALSSSTT